MNISEKILVYLHTIIEDNAFERLCTLVLHNFGYRDINPIGGKHDRGRDAEMRFFTGESPSGLATFFFYTRDQRSHAKFRHDIEKIRKYEHVITQIVVVTTRKITGATRRNWEKIAEEFGCEVRTYDREWFVLQLTANQHLCVSAGILDPTETTHISLQRTETGDLPTGSGHTSWELFSAREFEAAIPEFKKLLDCTKTDPSIWSALSWSYYQNAHYRDALNCIGRALHLEPKNKTNLGIKACILAEQGIETNARPSLVESKHIFTELAKSTTSWHCSYNLGNVLSALCDYESARDAFEHALKLSPNQPMIWKNLGGVHYHLGNVDEEIRCYDRALKIDPHLTEAIISKGVSLAIKHNQVRVGISLLQQAIQLDESVGRRWPYVWYWLSAAFQKDCNLEEALDAVDRGLEIVPDDHSLLKKKAEILAQSWREKPGSLGDALFFFSRLREIFPESFFVRQELAEIAYASGDKMLMHKLVNDLFPEADGRAIEILENCEFKIDSIGCDWLKHIDLYRRFREKSARISEYFADRNSTSCLVSEELKRDLLIQLGGVFGVACHSIVRLSPQERTKDAIESAAGKLRQLMLKVFRRFTYVIAEKMTIKSKEELCNQLANLMIETQRISLLEVSRQIGYICGHLSVSKEAVEEYQKDLAETVKWNEKIRHDTLIWANEVLKVFPEHE